MLAHFGLTESMGPPVESPYIAANPYSNHAITLILNGFAISMRDFKGSKTNWGLTLRKEYLSNNY